MKRQPSLSARHLTGNQDTIDSFDHLVAIICRQQEAGLGTGIRGPLRDRSGPHHGLPGLLRETTSQHHLSIILASLSFLMVSYS